METFEMYRRPTALVLPELVSLGVFITAESRLGGERQDGTSGMEIGFLEHGSVEWWNGAGLVEAEPPSILIDPPGDWQGGINAIVHPCSRYWLRFEFPENGALPGLSHSTTLAMKHSFELIDRHFFPGDPALGGLFANLMQQQRQPAIFSEDLSRAIFHQILVTVLRNYENLSNREISPQMMKAKAHIESQADGKIRVEDLAAIAGLSPGYFHEVFLREMGQTPLQYQLRHRINIAKRSLIATDCPITQIAFDVGFSSSQYFSTAFRKLVGLTPAAYRKIRSQAQDAELA